MYEHCINRVAVIGIDGSGKSTTGHESAQLLSEIYPNTDIRVADSNGLSYYLNGKVVQQRFPKMREMLPTPSSPKIEKIVRIGSFLLSRQYSEQFFGKTNNGLTISIREPFRIDPAVYLPIYGPEILRSLSPERRLKLFHHLTTACHPKMIGYLETNSDIALKNIEDRGDLDEHETPEGMRAIEDDLNKILALYSQLFQTSIKSIPALTPTSSSELAAEIERFIPGRPIAQVLIDFQGEMSSKQLRA